MSSQRSPRALQNDIQKIPVFDYYFYPEFAGLSQIRPPDIIMFKGMDEVQSSMDNQSNYMNDLDSEQEEFLHTAGGDQEAAANTDY